MTKIKKPSELKVQTTIKALLYGQPGIGKTTLALSAPSPLLLDFDNGVHRVSPLHQTDTVQMEKWQDVLDVLNEDLSNYSTLVIDTAGKMLDFMGAYLIEKNGKLGKANGALTLQGYGERKAEFNAFLKRVSQMGKNLVFVAHDKEEKEGDNKIVRPEIGGSSAGDLIKELDLVGYMEAMGKKRTISFDPCEKYYGKNTCHLPALIELPNTDTSVNNTLGGIFADYHKSLEQRKAVAADYKDLMEVINGKIEAVEDAETANEVSDWAKTFDGWIWDAKLVTGLKLREKTHAIGLTLNKQKKYEPAPVESAA